MAVCGMPSLVLSPTTTAGVVRLWYYAHLCPRYSCSLTTPCNGTAAGTPTRAKHDAALLRKHQQGQKGQKIILFNASKVSYPLAEAKLLVPLAELEKTANGRLKNELKTVPFLTLILNFILKKVLSPVPSFL
jgi:hypothetical protein